GDRSWIHCDAISGRHAVMPLIRRVSSLRRGPIVQITTMASGKYWHFLVLLLIWTSAAIATRTTQPTQGPVTGACHVSPIVSDLDKSAHFYHEMLGLDLVPAPGTGRLPWDTDSGHLD